jgi:hypothetical protein
MTAQLDHEDLTDRRIPQRGAAALWCTDPGSVDRPAGWGDSVEPPAVDTCALHTWTCIWCSMTPPICGSCRPVTPPCPATGAIHTCACRSDAHGAGAA